MNKNKCTLCGDKVNGTYISPKQGEKICMPCYRGQKRGLTWWVAVGVIEAFVLFSIYSIFSIIFTTFF